MEEEWRPVAMERFAGLYEVSNLGRVRSLHKRWRVPKIRALVTDLHGYYEVCLCRDSKPYTARVHRLVAEAFLADTRNALDDEVAHIDGSTTNNVVENLCWVSHAENMSHKLIHGTSAKGEKHALAKMTDSKVQEAIRLMMDGWPRRELAKRYSVSVSTIDDIASGKNWTHVERPVGFRCVRPSTQDGAFNVNAKLTWDQAEELRSRRLNGESCAALAKEYGISRATAFKIVSGGSYRRNSGAAITAGARRAETP